MPAYMIFIREEPIRDPVSMAEYSRINRENIGKFPMKPLVVYGKTEAVEGEAPDGTIVLEFPSVADAKAWYNSPEYQTALPYRMKAADYRAYIIEGFEPPR
jgi:uncharacterized protein (DUF1330 family)